MASSEDFQRVYELYKKQGVPNGISIVNFCQQQGIVYSQFERRFKSKKKPAKASVHPIRIVDMGMARQPQPKNQMRTSPQTWIPAVKRMPYCVSA